MTIIVEDGSNVENANAYVSLADTRVYAADRGVILSSDDHIIIPMVIRTTDYLETFRYQGDASFDSQSLSFPRKIYKNSVLIVDGVPTKLINAQNELVIAVHKGIDLFEIKTDARAIKRKRVGDIYKEFEGVDTFAIPALAPLLRDLIIPIPVLGVQRI